MKKQTIVFLAVSSALICLLSACNGTTNKLPTEASTVETIAVIETTKSPEEWSEPTNTAPSGTVPVTEPSETAAPTQPTEPEPVAETERNEKPTEPQPTADNAPGAEECNHQYKESKIVAPTCMEEGYTVYTCSKCGNQKIQDKTDKVPHTWTDWKQTKAPTCGAEGQETRTCSVCGTAETRPLEKTSHSWGVWTETTAPTCNMPGTKTRTCSVCKATETMQTDKTEHQWGAWETSQSATCTREGIQTRKCNVCGVTATNTLGKVPHDYVFIQTIAPTTTSEGYDLYRCSYCGTEDRRNTTPKLTKTLDTAHAMSAGNAYIQSAGARLDNTMTPDQPVSYYPPSILYGYWLEDQQDFDNEARNKAEHTIEYLRSISQDEGTEFNISNIRMRCYIRYFPEDDLYWIYVLYG